MLEFLLEAGAEDINVISGPIVHTPDEDSQQEASAEPSIPEPQGAWDHRGERVRVLDEHKSRFM
ncbi:MAG: hypothetical protein Q9183_007378 [Haloplaca sp. 2 TL-2023]